VRVPKLDITGPASQQPKTPDGLVGVSGMYEFCNSGVGIGIPKSGDDLLSSTGNLLGRSETSFEATGSAADPICRVVTPGAGNLPNVTCLAASSDERKPILWFELQSSNGNDSLP